MSSSKSSTLALALKGFFLDYAPASAGLDAPGPCKATVTALNSFCSSPAANMAIPANSPWIKLSVGKVTAFLQSLETSRKNRASTRNVRLSAIHSFCRDLGATPGAFKSGPTHPQHPFQTHRQRVRSNISTLNEIQAVLKAVDVDEGNGCRDLGLAEPDVQHRCPGQRDRGPANRPIFV